ncbi:MAG TPA: hypothetical protein VFR46_10490, partial [Actinomycetes bacterium]|nr:hypothetical protein [Actinomycetes bacterium]
PITGIVLGVLALIIGAVWTFFVIVGVRYTTEITNDCLDANPGASDEVIEQCISDEFEERFGVDLRTG